MLEIVRDLLPLNRTIVSDDARVCMERIGDRYPIAVHGYPTGAEFATWPVPPEWNVRGGSLSDGRRLVASYDESPLFIAPYSHGFRGSVTRDELLRHTFSNPEKPDAFCYEFRLAYNYRRRLNEWRISLPFERVQALPDGPFHVEIDVETKPGNLLIGEVAHPGATGNWVTFLAHYCHIGQANDGLAGVAIMLEAVARIARAYPEPRYGYKVLLFPETIGSSIYAATHEEEMDRTLGAVFSEMGGADQPLQLVSSRRGDTYIDRIFRYVLHKRGKWPCRVVDFREGWGNDELVFDSPGVGVPAVSIDRYPFDAYHTHHDNLDLVKPGRLEELVGILTDVAAALERDFVPRPRSRVPVYLTRYDLYADWTQDRDRYDLNALLLDSMWAGRSALDIALEHDIDADTVYGYLEQFVDNGLIEAMPITPEYTRQVRFLPRIAQV